MRKNEIDNATGQNHEGRRANHPVRILTASSIIGDKVMNSAGEDLGRIMDIMLNLNDGNIEYVVISYGGFLGVNRKYFAVPFNALVIDTDKHAFIFDQSKESFETHPGFDKDHWPESNFHTRATMNYGGFMGPNSGSDH
jgi:sporulation protein YlmC with PRC-barrel domain